VLWAKFFGPVCNQFAPHPKSL